MIVTIIVFITIIVVNLLRFFSAHFVPHCLYRHPSFITIFFSYSHMSNINITVLVLNTCTLESSSCLHNKQRQSEIINDFQLSSHLSHTLSLKPQPQLLLTCTWSFSCIYEDYICIITSANLKLSIITLTFIIQYYVTKNTIIHCPHFHLHAPELLSKWVSLLE